MKIKHIYFSRKKLVTIVSASIGVMMALPAAAALKDKLALNIEEQTAGVALTQLTRKAGVQLVMSSGLGDSVEVRGVEGSYTLAEALDAMLAGTSLVYEFSGDDAVIISKEAKEAKADSEKKNDNPEEIVVTSSWLTQDPAKLSRLVDRFGREEIEASGATSISDFLQRIPQNLNAPNDIDGLDGRFGTGHNIYGATGVNLRALGEGSTLVLLDGRRIARGGAYGEAQDLSNIPLNSVERIELLYGGASAIYGSDAIGGVVNIITRRDFAGTKVEYRYDTPEGGGTAETNISIDNTMSWESGRLSSSYSYRHRSSYSFLESEQQRFGVDDGTIDFERGTSSRISGVPGYITANSGSYLDTDTGEVVVGFIPLYFENDNGDRIDSVVGQYERFFSGSGSFAPILAQAPDGYNPVYLGQLPGGDGNLGLDSLNSLTALEQQLKQERGRSIYPTRDTHSASFALNQDLPFGVELFTRVSYSTNESFQNSSANDLNLSVSSNHPDNPWGVGHGLNWLNVGTLPYERLETEGNSLNFAFDLTGDIGETWRWKFGGGYSRNHNEGVRYNSINFDNIFGGVFEPDPDTGQFVYTPNLNSYNVYADNFGISQQEFEGFFFQDDIHTYTTNENRSLELELSGTVMSLPGGDVMGLIRFGGEEQDIVSYDEGNVGSTLLHNLGLPFDQYRQENGNSGNYARAEVLVPLIGEGNHITGVDSLIFTAAGAYDRFSDFDGESTWSTGMVWSPSDWLNVKFNRSVSVKMPNLIQYAFPATISRFTRALGERGINGLPDREGNIVTAPEGYQSPFGGGRWIFGTISGGNPDLEPQQNTEDSIAFQFRPSFVDDLHIDVSFHREEYYNLIGPLFINAESLTVEDVLENRFPSYIRPNPTFGVDEIDGQANPLTVYRSLIDRRPYNTGSIKSSGIDTTIRYGTDTQAGEFDVVLRHGYLLKSDYTQSTVCAADLDMCPVSTGSDKTAPLNQVGHAVPGASPLAEHSMSLQLRWFYEGISLSADTNWRSDTSRGLPSEFLTVSSSATPIDFIASYDFERSGKETMKWLRGSKVSLRVRNAFQSSSKVSTDTFSGFNNRRSYTIPRTFSLSFSKDLDI